MKVAVVGLYSVILAMSSGIWYYHTVIAQVCTQNHCISNPYACVLELKVREMSLTSQAYRHHFCQLVNYNFPEHYISALRLVIGGEMEGGREGVEGGREEGVEGGRRKWREGEREGREGGKGGREGVEGGREGKEGREGGKEEELGREVGRERWKNKRQTFQLESPANLEISNSTGENPWRFYLKPGDIHFSEQ